MREIKKHHIKRFIRLANELNKLMVDIQKYFPEAQYYLANDHLHLMSGDHHEMFDACEQRQDRIVETVTILGADGGDW